MEIHALFFDAYMFTLQSQSVPLKRTGIGSFEPSGVNPTKIMSACEKNAPFLFFFLPLCNPGDGAYSYFKHLKHLKRQHFELVINNFFQGITREPFTRSCHSSRLLNTLIAYLKREEKKETKDEGFYTFFAGSSQQKTPLQEFFFPRAKNKTAAQHCIWTRSQRVYIFIQPLPIGHVCSCSTL